MHWSFKYREIKDLNKWKKLETSEKDHLSMKYKSRLHMRNHFLHINFLKIKRLACLLMVDK